MNRREFLKSTVFATATFALPGCSAKVSSLGFGSPKKDIKSKPNILFILADDLGWSQISCYGSDFYETPNIDRLAGEGMKFTDAYAA